MKNWQDNKKVHNKLWDSVYDLARAEADGNPDFLEAWENINVKELMRGSLGEQLLRSIRGPGAVADDGTVHSFSTTTAIPWNPDRTPYIIDGAHKFGTLLDCIHIKMGIFFERILANLDFEPELIVDLGSGWGRNSLYFSKYLNKEYNFLCCELSDSGRKCADYLAKIYDLPIEALPFNYHDNTSLLEYFSKNNFSRVLFYSIHSIEQIQKIEKSFFTSILDLPIEKVKFIHIEPIDWQILGLPKSTAGAAPHYNENLYSILEELEDEGSIKISIVKPSFFGLKHTNTGALLEWEKISSNYALSKNEKLLEHEGKR